MTKNSKIADVALEAILEARRPLSSREIFEYALKRHRGLFKGRTPRRSIQAAVWKSIHLHDSTPFKMLGEGRVNRRYWVKDLPVPRGWAAAIHKKTARK